MIVVEKSERRGWDNRSFTVRLSHTNHANGVSAELLLSRLSEADAGSFIVGEDVPITIGVRETLRTI